LTEVLIKTLNQSGRTITMARPDLNQACRYAHHLVAMYAGAMRAVDDPVAISYCGSHSELSITEEMVEQVFHIPAQIVADPVTGTPMCIPIPHMHPDPSCRSGNGSGGRALFYLPIVAAARSVSVYLLVENMRAILSTIHLISQHYFLRNKLIHNYTGRRASSGASHYPTNFNKAGHAPDSATHLNHLIRSYGNTS